MKVNLSKINDVKEFVNIVSNIKGDVDLKSGHYVVDAKSMMGIFSLDLSRPVRIVFGDEVSDFDIGTLKRFMVE